MTTHDNQHPEFTKPFYKIKDVAEFVGVPPSTLRFWEQKFPDEISPVRNAGNIRYYTPQMIDTLRMIRYLLYDRGMKIEAVRDELRHNRRNVSRRQKIVDNLTSVRNELKELLKALDRR